jgi:hypothetical protein
MCTLVQIESDLELSFTASDAVNVINIIILFKCDKPGTLWLAIPHMYQRYSIYMHDCTAHVSTVLSLHTDQ